MNIEVVLAAAARRAVKELYGADVPENLVQLQKTKKEFEGQLTLVVFPLLKTSHKRPEETAEDIGQWLVKNEPSVARYNVVKGFLNLCLADDSWVRLLNAIAADPQYGVAPVTAESPLVMVEYSSPNTNKPLHLGHVRNNLLGWALSNVIAAGGNRVVRTNIVNDRGIHICKSMLAWQKWGAGETPQSSGKKGDHLIGDYYVLFDKHYREEVKQLQAQYEAEGMDAEQAETKADKTLTAERKQVKVVIYDMIYKAEDIIRQNPQLAVLVYMLLFSGPLYLLIRHCPAIPDMRFSECFVAVVYIVNMLLIYIIIPSFFCFSFKAENYFDTLVILLAIIPIKQLTGYSYWGTIWRLLIAFIPFFILLLGLFVVVSMFVIFISHPEIFQH